MTAVPPRVVYDCNIFVQALINLNGPAGRCLREAQAGHVLLFASPYVLAEVREIHLKTPSKYAITAQQTDELAQFIASFATIVSDVPQVYQHPVDPDDSHYVNLAMKAEARLIVSATGTYSCSPTPRARKRRISGSASPHFAFSTPSNFSQSWTRYALRAVFNAPYRINVTRPVPPVRAMRR